MATKKKDTRKFASPLVKKVILLGEELHRATAVTHHEPWGDPKAIHNVGGSCACCGAGAHIDEDGDWWLVFKAGLVDSDGVYYSMLCGGPDGSGCLPDIRAENAKRKPTLRDEAAAIVTDLLDGDMDGAEAMMEDFDYLGMLDEMED